MHLPHSISVASFIAHLLSRQSLTVHTQASNSRRRRSAYSSHRDPMEKSRSVPHEHSSEYYGGYDYEDVSGGAAGKSYSFNGPSARDDPEAKRRRRVAAYNVFGTQARLKSTVRSSVKWLKSKFSDVRYGGI